VTAGVAGCGHDPKPYVVAGKDVSCAECAARNNYDAEFDRLLDWTAEQRGVLVADVIDGNALASFQQRFRGAFEPDPSLGGNPQLIADDLRAKARRERGRAHAALEVDGQTKGSDPLGFALAAAPQLRGHEEAHLVFLSDMVQRAPKVDRLDLYQPAMTAKQIEATVKRLKAERKLPNLTGVHVAVVGGGRSSGQITAEQAIAIKRFWMRLFREAGARAITWGPRFTPPVEG